MLVIGIALATSSTFLFKPAQSRFGMREIVGASRIMMVVSSLAFILLPRAILVFIPIFLFYFMFGMRIVCLIAEVGFCIKEMGFLCVAQSEIGMVAQHGVERGSPALLGTGYLEGNTRNHGVFSPKLQGMTSSAGDQDVFTLIAK